MQIVGSQSNQNYPFDPRDIFWRNFTKICLSAYCLRYHTAQIFKKTT